MTEEPPAEGGVYSGWLARKQGSLGRRKVSRVKLVYINLMKTDTGWKEGTLYNPATELETGSREHLFDKRMMIKTREELVNIRRRRLLRDNSSTADWLRLPVRSALHYE